MKRNMYAGKRQSGGLSVNVFTEDELDQIHAATLEVLRDVNDESLAVDVIREIGDFNHFLSHDHTFKHMRTEQTHPHCIDRRIREEWEKSGGTDIYQRAWEKARDILENHKPEPLPAQVLAKIRSIVEETEDELRISKGKDREAGRRDKGYRRAAG